MKMAIIGSTGAVGQELKRLVQENNTDPSALICFDSKSSISFDGIDLAFFCVSKEVAKELIPKAREKGVLCIDSSTAYRADPDVPLVIPEINGHILNQHQGIIASPNCTTTLMLLPLAPLHRRFRIKRIVAATYQAVSGAGRGAMEELEEQTKAVLANEVPIPNLFPYPCAFNVFPHESAMDDSGYVAEEIKMHQETRKILDDENVSVTATCVRVPVFRVHSIALNVEFQNPIQKEEVLEILKKAPGVVLQNTPIPLDAAQQKPVFCGRIRLDHTQSNTLEMWVVGDQLLKGAALNMIQIAGRLYTEQK
ncbi:MAG: Aspartate-semialdehyde dehydrogenase [Chlamydiae bacterium]|nr:Aspartate-semialdehyde dehydrogenase [Chlamydiota bacterium]